MCPIRIKNLGLFGPLAKDAVPTLIEALKDPAPFVRKDAAAALGKIGSAAKAAVPALEEAAKDPFVRAPREEALKRIGGE